MRIGIDLRSTQTALSRNRGVGVFTRTVVEPILRGWQVADSGEKDEFFLIYDSGEADSTLKPVLADMPFDSCRVTWAPVPPSFQLAAGEPGMAVINGDFNAFLASLRLDLLHLPGALEFDIRLPTHIVVCPYVVTLYDLPSLPSSAPQQTRRYVERLGLVMRADHIVATSARSQEDAQVLLGIKPDKMSVIDWVDDLAFDSCDSVAVAGHYSAVYRQVGVLPDEAARAWRVALWTPLRPTSTGIADYVEELLPYFAAWQTEERPMRVDIFTQSDPDTPWVRDTHAFFAATAFEAIHAWRPYDATIYHIGSTYAHHEFIYKQALKNPGIVVVHDPNLHAYPTTQILAVGQQEAYIEQIVAEEGEPLREFVQQALAEDAFWDALYHEYNMDKALLRASRAVIYHSYYAMREAQQRVPGVPAFYIPLYAAEPPDALSAAESKRRVCAQYNLPPETLIIGTFGVMARKKRVDELIRAFSLLRCFYPSLVLLIVGDIAAYDPLCEAQKAGYSTERIFVTGEVEMAEFMTYLQAVDIGVSLRYPTLGETSAVISRLMGMGKPLIISDIPQFRELPDECCWKVPVNNCEVEVLESYLAELIDNPELRAAMGYNARLYARTCMSPAYVASLYRQVIDHEISSAPGPQAEATIPLRYRHQADLAVLTKQLRQRLRRDTAIEER